MKDTRGILVLLEKRGHTIRVSNVELRKAKAALGSKPREVGVGSGARQIVDDDNVVSVPQMARCGIGPDESGTARDDHFQERTRSEGRCVRSSIPVGTVRPFFARVLAT